MPLNEKFVETQIEARERLVRSAKLAYGHGYSAYEWETDPKVIEFATACGVEDVIDHIGCWVWLGLKGRR
jgi:hypothetical protein